MTVAATEASRIQVVVLTLGQECYAIPLSEVQEVQRIVAVSNVGHPPAARGAHPRSVVVGTIVVRGELATVVDLHSLAGLQQATSTLDQTMIICRIRGELVAFLADSVEEVAEVSQETMQTAGRLHPFSGQLLGTARLGDGLVHLIDVESLVRALEADEADER